MLDLPCAPNQDAGGAVSGATKAGGEAAGRGTNSPRGGPAGDKGGAFWPTDAAVLALLREADEFARCC